MTKFPRQFSIYFKNQFLEIENNYFTFFAKCLKSSLFVILPVVASFRWYGSKILTTTSEVSFRNLSLYFLAASEDVSAAAATICWGSSCTWGCFSFCCFCAACRSASRCSRRSLAASSSSRSSSARSSCSCNNNSGFYYHNSCFYYHNNGFIINNSGFYYLFFANCIAIGQSNSHFFKRH